MKKQFLVLVLILANSILGICQTIQPAPTGKAVVYFVRPSAMGFAINFSYFDSTQLIGKFNGPKYIRYECEPGKHLFWAVSENRDFIEAEVEAGKIYFIESMVKMGAVKARVELKPVDPKDEKTMGRIFKLLEKKPSESFSQSVLENETDKDQIQKGMEKYKTEKEKGDKIQLLDKSMYYQK